MTADPTRGLYGKYLVERVDGKPLKGGRCIVLEVGDPNAWPALWEWADTVDDAGYAALAADVRLRQRAEAGVKANDAFWQTEVERLTRLLGEAP